MTLAYFAGRRITGTAADRTGGTWTNLPAGWIFTETDTGLELYWNGTAWVTLNPMQPKFFLKGTSAAANRRYIAGVSYKAPSILLTSTTAPAVNTLWALPLIVPSRQTFDVISFRVTTNATAGGVARAGIYRDNGNDYPGVLYFDTGSIDTTTPAAPNTYDTTITSGLQAFDPGLYWLAWECGTAAPQIVSLGTGLGFEFILGTSSGFSVATHAGYGWSIAHTFGALPDPYTASGTMLTGAPAAGSPIPAIGLRPI